MQVCALLKRVMIVIKCRVRYLVPRGTKTNLVINTLKRYPECHKVVGTVGKGYSSSACKPVVAYMRHIPNIPSRVFCGMIEPMKRGREKYHLQMPRLSRFLSILVVPV